MDTSHPAIQLCLQGSRAEFERRLEEARALYQQAWVARTDAYTACIAAHYVARFQADPAETLHWNQLALQYAEAVNDERVTAFYPSLYVNLGRSHEVLGNQAEAKRFYDLAAALGLEHQAE